MGSSGGEGDGELRILETAPEEEEQEEDLLSDLPAEALMATTRSQFVNHMRPYAWVKFPSATSTEVNSLVNARWQVLKESRKSGTYNNRLLAAGKFTSSECHIGLQYSLLECLPVCTVG